MHAIEVSCVSKAYRIAHERQTRLAERALSLFQPVPYEHFQALADVSLHVPHDSFVGIIGPNGSGKSTLLKLIAGVLVPDSGDIHVQGRIAPLLELGLGFHPELTARENVTLYGAVLGYPVHEMRDRVDAAIAFAELERFRDAKLKSFSSGMIARLAFGTALLADADILLLDEVLAVGDAHFQQKCFAAFGDVRKRGKTVVLVSHDLGAMQRLCDRVYWFDHGRLVMSGDAAEVVHTYLAASLSENRARAADGKAGGEPAPGRFGDGAVAVVRGALEREDGTPIARVPAGARVALRLSVECTSPSDDPVVGFGVRRLADGGAQTVYSISTELLGVRTGRFVAGDRVEIRMPFRAALLNGHYAVTVAIAKRGAAGAEWSFHDWVSDFVTFEVEGSPCTEGLVDLGAGFECAAVTGDLARAGAS